MLFRRTDKFGYSRYYGGGGPLWILRIIVTLAVIFGLVIGGVAWSLQKYMVYTEEGGHLELPWSKKDEDKDKLPNPEDDIIIDIPDASQEGDGEESESPDQSQDVSDISQLPDASQEGEQSEAPDASQEGEQSEAPDHSQDTPAPAEPKPSLWQRFTAWLGGLFSSDKPDKPADNKGDTSQGGDTSAESSAGDASQSAAEPDAPPAPAPAPLKGGILVQHVSMGDFGSGHGAGVVKNHKGNGIMLFMKESGGRLNFNASSKLAHDFKTYSDSNVTNGLKKSLEKLKADGYYTVAYINVFQDGAMEKRKDYALLDEDGDSWYDGERNWADPANTDYQGYIVDIVKELAALGYDEIVMKNAAYPTNGDLNSINPSQYNTAAFTDTLSVFYGKLAEAVKDTDTLLSVHVTKDVVTKGEDKTTGQTLDAVKKLGGRVWVEAKADEADALAKTLTDAGFPENALGLLTNKITADVSWCQMNVD